MSRTNTSPTPLVSPGTRSSEKEANATYLPSPETAGSIPHTCSIRLFGGHGPASPLRGTLTRVVVRSRRSRRNTSVVHAASPATRFDAIELNTTKRPSAEIEAASLSRSANWPAVLTLTRSKTAARAPAAPANSAHDARTSASRPARTARASDHAPHARRGPRTSVSSDRRDCAHSVGITRRGLAGQRPAAAQRAVDEYIAPPVRVVRDVSRVGGREGDPAATRGVGQRIDPVERVRVRATWSRPNGHAGAQVADEQVEALVRVAGDEIGGVGTEHDQAWSEEADADA